MATNNAPNYTAIAAFFNGELRRRRTGCADQLPKIYDFRTGQALHVANGGASNPHQIRFAPNQPSLLEVDIWVNARMSTRGCIAGRRHFSTVQRRPDWLVERMSLATHAPPPYNKVYSGVFANENLHVDALYIEGSASCKCGGQVGC